MKFFIWQRRRWEHQKESKQHLIHSYLCKSNIIWYDKCVRALFCIEVLSFLNDIMSSRDEALERCNETFVSALNNLFNLCDRCDWKNYFYLSFSTYIFPFITASLSVSFMHSPYHYLSFMHSPYHYLSFMHSPYHYLSFTHSLSLFLSPSLSFSLFFSLSVSITLILSQLIFIHTLHSLSQNHISRLRWWDRVGK